MLKKARALVPAFALIALMACSDVGGPTGPDLDQRSLDQEQDDPSQEVDRTQARRKLPLDQRSQDDLP